MDTRQNTHTHTDASSQRTVLTAWLGGPAVVVWGVGLALIACVGRRLLLRREC